MSKSGFLCIGIPAYNEGQNIEPLVQRLKNLSQAIEEKGVSLRVLIVDDASKDNTAAVVEELISVGNLGFELSLLRHQQNRGLSGAMESIWNWAITHVDDPKFLGLGTLDGDNSHNPEVFERMLPILDFEADVVIASRYRRGSVIKGVNLYRQTLSLGVSFIFQVLGQFKNVRDYSCGFRLYHPRILKKVGLLSLKYRSFACMVEILKRCHSVGSRFAEVPFELRYDLKKGESKMPLRKTIQQTLQILFDRSL